MTQPAPRESERGTLLLKGDDAAVESAFAADVGAVPAPKPAASTLVVNVGTRLRATLDMPLRTGATLAPATATLAEDLRVGARVALAAGTRLVGSAFATPHDDRVQIVWRALVRDGRTLAMQAETIGSDGAPGLVGKLVRRHRKGVVRRVGSALAGTAGELAGGALPLGDTLPEQAGAALAGRAGRELSQLSASREWLQSDAVIELQAGVMLTVYVGADLTLGDDGER